MISALHYTGLALDRAGPRRANAAWIDGLRAGPDAQVIPLWRDQCLLAAAEPVILTGSQAMGELDNVVFLGISADIPVFACDLSALDQQAALRLSGADDAADVRAIVGAISTQQAGMFAYARGLLHWQRRQQFCGCCGGRCEPRDGGHVRACQDCDVLHFPRIEPAIIVLVEHPDDPRRCLLGRHAGALPGRFSTLAGFVEIGESLEDAVRREVAEEAGVVVGEVSYQGSQAWPFPAGLMVGFRALAVAAEIRVDGAELTEARWFTAEEVSARISDESASPPYRVDSIGRALIEGWLSGIK